MEVKTSQGSGDTAVMAVSQNVPSPPPPKIRAKVTNGETKGGTQITGPEQAAC